MQKRDKAKRPDANESQRGGSADLSGIQPSGKGSPMKTGRY